MRAMKASTQNIPVFKLSSPQKALAKVRKPNRTNNAGPPVILFVPCQLNLHFCSKCEMLYSTLLNCVTLVTSEFYCLGSCVLLIVLSFLTCFLLKTS